VLQDAARTIAVLSGDYLTSVYGGAEWQAAWASDPQGTGRKLLTVRVAECDRPGLLAGVVGVDLFGLAEATAKARLRRMVSEAIVGRAKPEVPPGFPGAGRAMPRAARFPGALPRVWEVPARNPHFIGRGPDLKKLTRALAAGAAVTVHSVHGMGGVGKTQLATEYAHAHATDYDLVWWIAAEEPASIPDQFTALAARLGLDPVADPKALQALVHDRLRSVPGWLLIFDNADRATDIRPWLSTGPLPPGIRGHVIVTTRRGGFAAMGRVLDLDVIAVPDAVRMLRARVPDLGQQTAKLIAEELGRLPLALEQAAAWLDRSQMPGEEYLELLRSRGADLYARGQVHDRPDTIATLWEISVGRITAENPAAVQLLGVCAYLAPEPVPLDLFTAHADLLPEPLSSAAADRLAFSDAIAVLVDYSLAKRTPAGLQLHRLVQATIRARSSSPALPPAHTSRETSPDG
jgi:TIR domain/NB-ARC domain